jgi:hypothetical protein
MKYLKHITLTNIIFCGAFFATVFGILDGCKRTKTTNDPIFCNCKDSVEIRHDTIYVDKKKDEIVSKPIPAVTKYKVSDIVCAWGKWTGVVVKINWSKADSRLLVYQIQIYKEAVGENDGEWVEEWYYDTELTPGKCQ